MNFKYDIFKSSDNVITNWSGGVTREIAIYPINCLYKNLDFKWRISSAKIETSSSTFTKLEGYNRYIMSLDNQVELTHENHYKNKLNKYEVDYFRGAWDTNCIGKCSDFNLMLKDGINGNIKHVNKSHIFINELYSTTGFYALTSNCKINISKNNNVVFETIINQGDLILFHNVNSLDNDLIVNCKSIIRVDIE